MHSEARSRRSMCSRSDVSHSTANSVRRSGFIAITEDPEMVDGMTERRTTERRQGVRRSKARREATEEPETPRRAGSVRRLRNLRRYHERRRNDDEKNS
jgi:hypothetical protein